ncbi:hypothetical protein G3446_27170 [Thiorhodococcus minor]|uniref:Uncharacterized protein n=2 Tax=Thiorhodococcus minor TaxID=57489 RepID=A0A6M0K7S2_9GAMM|nr:hypothetical protein [Thiorhodococcus minor]
MQTIQQKPLLQGADQVFTLQSLDEEAEIRIWEALPQGDHLKSSSECRGESNACQ